MSKGIQKHQELDPELAALFEETTVHEPEVQARPKAPSGVTPAVSSEEEDPLLVLKAMAERQQAAARDRRELAPGFDTVENDVSNVLKVGWDFITR